MLRLFGLPLAVVVAALTVSLNAQGARGRGGAQVELPDGPGKEAVAASCAACHGLNSITGSAGYTQEGWRDLIATMVKLPEPQVGTVTQYLAAHFPPKTGRAPDARAGHRTRSPSASGSFPRSASARAIRFSSPTGRSGGPASTAA